MPSHGLSAAVPTDLPDGPPTDWTGRPDGFPADVQAVCLDWLAELDRTSPGLVTGLYLWGGIGFGEYVVERGTSS